MRCDYLPVDVAAPGALSAASPLVLPLLDVRVVGQPHQGPSHNAPGVADLHGQLPCSSPGGTSVVEVLKHQIVDPHRNTPEVNSRALCNRLHLSSNIFDSS